MATYRDFLFLDEETGEQFFVELKAENYGAGVDLEDEAREIAAEYFEAPVLIDEVDPMTADMLGYDTY
jgi:hypothetical protein